MGLNDRPYMRVNFGNSGNSYGAAALKAVYWLIGINAALYFFIPGSSELFHNLIVTSGNIRSFRFYTLLTAGFMHANLSHLFFNMWGLYLFGTLVAPHVGAARFVWLYVVGAVSGNALFLLFNWYSRGGLLGASGALFAVMVGAMLFEPERKFMMIFLPFMPMRTVTLVVCYTILEVLLLFGGQQDGIAHLAHLGGALGGYVYLKILYHGRLPWDFFRRSPRPMSWEPNRARDVSFTVESSGGSVSSRELDALLDKISHHGINSLSETEMARLRQAREEMRAGRGR